MKKLQTFQTYFLRKPDEIFAEKERSVNSDDQPWITHKLKLLDRKRKRIYHKERRSEKWSKLNKAFKKEVKAAKASFYAERVADLKNKKAWAVVLLFKTHNIL